MKRIEVIVGVVRVSITTSYDYLPVMLFAWLPWVRGMFCILDRITIRVGLWQNLGATPVIAAFYFIESSLCVLMPPRSVTPSTTARDAMKPAND